MLRPTLKHFRTNTPSMIVHLEHDKESVVVKIDNIYVLIDFKLILGYYLKNFNCP